MTVGKQDWMAGRLDRAREQTTRPKLKAARAMQIRMEARMDLRRQLARYETDAEKAAYVENLMDMEAETLPSLISRVDAMTAFTKRAADIGVSLRLPSAVARGRAEQLFKRAANEDHANDGDAQ